MDLRQPLFESMADAIVEPLVIDRDIPFVDRDDERAALAQHLIGDSQILRFEPQSRVEHQHDDLGEIDRVKTIGDRKFLELVVDLGAFAHAGRVDQFNRPTLPFPGNVDRIARNPRLRPGDQPVLPQHLVDQRRFSGVGAADNGELERPIEFILEAFGHALGVVALGCAIVFDMGSQPLKQIGQPLAMFGAEPDRIAEAEFVAVVESAITRATFGLVADKDHRGRRPAQPARDLFVERRQPGARIEHEERSIGAGHGSFGLGAHAAWQTLRIFVFIAGGVDDAEIEPEQLDIAFAAVSSHPRPIIDQCELLADKPVEERRFADIGPPDNGDNALFRHE